ncbi:MAG: tRNA (adenosine(37)-N6)-threonylcarbamoyltransferase complex dimerization subunit type 1 TsaB [Filomicrobium sp.]
MITLALDSCYDACSAALASKDGVILASAFEPMSMGHAERLVPMVDDIVSEAGIAYSDIGTIAVTNGPGTFTGTRIGVAAARAFALALEKPLIGETSLAVMAEVIAADLPTKSSEDLDDVNILVATDARRGEVYAQLFQAAGIKARTDPMVITPADAAEMLNEGASTILAGSGAESIAATKQSPNGKIRLGPVDLLPNAANLAIRVAQGRTLAEPSQKIAPLYLRPADAKPQSGKSIPRISP